jgi:two-component system sensor kinase FixL
VAELKIIANRDGTIEATEGAVDEILGWDPEDLIGENIVEIVPFKYRERHAQGWERWTTTGEKRAMGSWLEVQARRKDGNTIDITFCVTERDDMVEALLETPADPNLPGLKP